MSSFRCRFPAAIHLCQSQDRPDEWRDETTKFLYYSRLKKHICLRGPRRNPWRTEKGIKSDQRAPSRRSQSTDVDHRQRKLSHQHQQCPILLLLLLLQPHTHHWRFTQAYKIPRSIAGFIAAASWDLTIWVYMLKSRGLYNEQSSALTC